MSEGYDRKNKPEPQQRQERHRAQKNRRKWCKGKPGVEHTLEVTLPPNIPGWKKDYCKPAPAWATDMGWWIFCDHLIQCTVCGKHLGQPDTCPTWEKQIRE